MQPQHSSLSRVGMGLGMVAWGFLIYPLAQLFRCIAAFRRGDRPWNMVDGALTLLALGVLCIVGAMSLDTERYARAAWGALVASFFGILGNYSVTWEPGMWIVRGIVVAVILGNVIAGRRQR